jgi:hypothetical protein
MQLLTNSNQTAVALASSSARKQHRERCSHAQRSFAAPLWVVMSTSVAPASGRVGLERNH